MYYFIMNPTAQSRNGHGTWPAVKKILDEHSVSYSAHVTQYAGHAKKLAQEFSTLTPDATIVVIGGDGTIHEVLNGLENLDTVTLGVIPQGSANDFAKGMNIPKDPREAAEVILSGEHVTLMDVGYVRGKGRRERFGVSTGIGFDASICHEALNSRIKNALNGFRLGSLTYGAIAVRQILFYTPTTVRIRCDGGEIQTFPKTWFVAVMNNKYEGGGFMMTPDAVPTDGLLNIFVCCGISRARLITALPATTKGAHVTVPKIHFLKSRSIEILSNEARPIHLDGESGGIHRTLSVGFEEERLRVLTRA